MKKILLNTIILFFLFGCTDNTSDCLSSSGAIVNKTIFLTRFSKVILHEGIELEIKKGSENSLQISYGENLINNVSTTIKDDVLNIGNSSCNLIRSRKPAKLILTAIDISEIRNASQYVVFSKEVLKFNNLTLISENHKIDYINVGDFNLHIENNELNIISNNVSNFIIKGKTNKLFVGFYGGEGKFNGGSLTAKNVDIFHRGINTITIYPIQQLTGEIRSVGNVIALSKPPIVNVTEFYTGTLIFK